MRAVGAVNEKKVVTKKKIASPEDPTCIAEERRSTFVSSRLAN